MSTELASAVNVFFDRLTAFVPPTVFVGRLNALRYSLVVAAVVAFVASVAIASYRRQAETPTEHAYVYGLVVVTAIFVVYLQRTLNGIFYSFEMVKMNKAHFSNVHWLSEYMHALRVGL